jgi:hypothetical protein
LGDLDEIVRSSEANSGSTLFAATLNREQSRMTMMRAEPLSKPHKLKLGAKVPEGPTIEIDMLSNSPIVGEDLAGWPKKQPTNTIDKHTIPIFDHLLNVEAPRCPCILRERRCITIRRVSFASRVNIHVPQAKGGQIIWGQKRKWRIQSGQVFLYNYPEYFFHGDIYARVRFEIKKMEQLLTNNPHFADRIRGWLDDH